MDENKIYLINVGDFAAGETVYPNRCLSAASVGGSGVPSDTIPWEGTDNQPWDYKYEDGVFVLDPIEIVAEEPAPSRLDKLEAQLAYVSLMTGCQPD